MPNKPVISSYEAKLLYTLLDAAADEGRLRDSRFASRWFEVKARAVSFPTIERASLFALVSECDAAGVFDGTWMRERWAVVQRRVEQDPLEYPASQAPFATPAGKSWDFSQVPDRDH